jgi:hypothetical protein
MGLGEIFSLAFEGDDVGTRGWDGLGWNRCLEIVFRDKTRRQRLTV